ncbi:MAG: ABC transporter substrate-binding protein [Phycisphaerales bacterium]
MTLPRLLLLALAACLSIAACGRAPGEAPPQNGTPGSAPVPRIVTLSPALAVIIRDLGLAERIVGRDGFDMVLDPAVPVCGDYNGIDYERLARVNPTHILMQWGARERPRRLEDMARQRGWIIRDFSILNLDEIPAATLDLAQLLGVEERGRALADDMHAAWKRRPGVESAGRILLLGSASPPSALGPASWHHQMLERIGGTPALREGGAFVRLDSEDVLRLAPDAIILFSPAPARTSHRGVVKGAGALPALGGLARLDIPAIRNGRVAMIDDPLGLTPSTAMIGVGNGLAELLAEWAATGEAR